MTIPRNFFPNMPDEVFTMWLKPIAVHYGWPFIKPDESKDGTKWAAVFGDYDLNYWVSVKWRLSEIAITEETFTDFTCFRLNSIIKGCVECIPTLFTGVSGSQERFRACADFIRNNGRIPCPIIVFDKGCGIEILDGNHRVAALLHVGIPNGYKIPAWIPYLK